MENKKEFHYSHDDFKGSPFLIEDCKNHYVHTQQMESESDLDIIINGVQNNLNNIEIVKQLPCVTADNLHSIMSGIKDVRNNVNIDEKSIFVKHMLNLLNSYGFNFERYQIRRRQYKKEFTLDEYGILSDVVHSFVKFCNAHDNDYIDIIFNP